MLRNVGTALVLFSLNEKLPGANNILDPVFGEHVIDPTKTICLIRRRGYNKRLRPLQRPAISCILIRGKLAVLETQQVADCGTCSDITRNGDYRIIENQHDDLVGEKSIGCCISKSMRWHEIYGTPRIRLAPTSM